MSTVYDIEQLVANESGWLFYEAALKNWKAVNSYLVGTDILDIGCGSGLSMALSKVFNPKINFVGFEGSEAARSLWTVRNLSVDVGDIYHLPFVNHSFDTVYSSHVLEHLEDPRKAVQESIRVAKRRIIHSVPDGNVDNKNFGTPHLQYFNRVSYFEMFTCLDIDVVAYFSIADVHMSSLLIVANIN